MRRIPLSVLALAASFSSVSAQECLWSASGPVIPSGTLLYDTVGSRILVVNWNGTIQTWNGTSWVVVPTGTSLSHAGSLAFDAHRGRIVQHGSAQLAAPTNDTWEWDGLNWALTSVSGPSSAFDPMVYDEARGRTVLFRRMNPGTPGETWTWDGAAWIRVNAIGPPSNTHVLVFDTVRQAVIMIGPILGNGRSVWEWDGAAWNRRSDSPITWQWGRAVLDTTRACLVIHGDRDRAHTLEVETWELGSTTGIWTLRSQGGPEAADFVFDRVRGIGMMREDTVWNPTPGSWIWNGNGSIPPFVITQQPASMQVQPGWAAEFRVVTAGNGSRTYQWYHGQVPLTNGGHISGADSPTLRLNPVSAEDGGPYSAIVSSPCMSLSSTWASLFVTGQPCFANCDGSTVAPVLTANDFGCFINKFAAGDPWANCDGSTGTPHLTHGDFQCFINSFAGGC